MMIGRSEDKTMQDAIIFTIGGGLIVLAICAMAWLGEWVNNLGNERTKK